MFGLKQCAICVHFVGMWMHLLAKLGWWIGAACLLFARACFCFSFMCRVYNWVDIVCNVCTCCGHVDAHACKALFVDCCCLSVVCQRWRFLFGIYDRLVTKWLALWVHSVGMLMHMFAKLGWWTVVACLWLVNACFLIVYL